MLLDRRLEGGERVAPEAVEVVAKARETGDVRRVDATRPERTKGDEPRALENAEVLGDGRPRDGEPSRDFADGARSLEDALEDGATGGVAEGVPSGGLVSQYLP